MGWLLRCTNCSFLTSVVIHLFCGFLIFYIPSFPFGLSHIAYVKIGGMEILREKYMQAIPSKLIPNSTCGIPTEHSWQLLRPYNDDEMPWPGFLLGQTPASIWYWCTDQV